jgi:hypothetical protein
METTTSEAFSIHQGVKQGGLLSAELYKLYIEDLLKTYENSKLGFHIGTLTINAIACADDTALGSSSIIFHVDGCTPNKNNFLIKISMSTTSKADLASRKAK